MPPSEPSPGEEVVLLCGPPRSAVDGIQDHARRMAEALSRRGYRARVAQLGGGTADSAPGTGGTWVVEYNPFSFGRGGVAPHLPAALARARRAGTRIVTMVHEPYVPVDSARTLVLGAWQRAQLAAVLRISHAAFASMERYCAMLARRAPGGRIGHLPVGSNLPDARAERAAARAAVGWPTGTLMVASLGTGHWSLSAQSIRAALEALAAEGHDVGYLNLGAGPIDTATLSPRLAVHAPGPLPLADLARLVAAADLFLAPFSDGASTRRGSLMAALQHGVPVVTTAGSSTGPALAGAAGLVFAADASAAAFVEGARRVAGDAGERAQLGRAARTLYEQRFDWDVTAAQLERELR